MFSKLTPLAETNFPPLLCENAAGRLLHSDSRQIKQGDIFVACQGEYTDGRNYIPAAIANGATFVFGMMTANLHGIPNGTFLIKALKI